MTVGEAIKEAIKHAEGVMDENLEMTKEEALEQEPILDKIRAEIEHLAYYCCEIHPKYVIDDVLAIIDKYKAESEE